MGLCIVHLCLLMQDLSPLMVQVSGSLVIRFINSLATILLYVGIQLVIKALSLKMANFLKILMLAFLNGL